MSECSEARVINTFYITCNISIEKRGGNSQWKQQAICFKFIFRFSIRAKWRNGTRKLVRSPKNPNKNKKRDDRKNSDDPLEDLLEWSEEFRENQEDTELPASAGIKIKDARYLYSLPERSKLRSMLANQNDKGFLQKMHWRSSTSCRKVWCHRYAVVVQDISTRWVQSYPCKTKTSYETEAMLKFLEPSHKPKVVYTDNSLEFGNAREDLSWNQRTSTPHRFETNGIAERAVADGKTPNER